MWRLSAAVRCDRRVGVPPASPMTPDATTPPSTRTAPRRVYVGRIHDPGDYDLALATPRHAEVLTPPPEAVPTPPPWRPSVAWRTDRGPSRSKFRRLGSPRP